MINMHLCCLQYDEVTGNEAFADDFQKASAHDLLLHLLSACMLLCVVSSTEQHSRRQWQSQ